jgi:hypothetical protein
VMAIDEPGKGGAAVTRVKRDYSDGYVRHPRHYG